LIFSENGLDYVQITDRNGHIIQRPDWDSNSQKILLDSDALTKSETLNVPVLLKVPSRIFRKFITRLVVIN